ncbi:MULTISPECIES: malonic semialdehyde reductase [unclassified Mycobacterium]|uniref:malonic semialdehyde reductase n=1 Tax=unclassified Mycobacterium TaxID=2642494 RepID=UPI000491D13F|nr:MULTISPECIES: malonic semialdehyde reductase [unclassified Mycobacterium]SEB26070.1 3-hydroxypropanoate dehydrogenase [Mycobacterium sp. 283mftsu]
MSDGIGDAQVAPLPVLDEAGRQTLFTRARTVHAFADDPVSDDQLIEAWELARWAPTSVNTQPLRILFVRKGDARDRLAPHMFDSNQAKTAGAPVVAVLAIDRRFDLFEANTELRSETGIFSGALQSAYFIMALRAVGLAAGPMGGFDMDAVDREFFPDGKWKSVLIVNIGYPGANPWADRLPRLDPAQIIRSA